MANKSAFAVLFFTLATVAMRAVESSPSPLPKIVYVDPYWALEQDPDASLEQKNGYYGQLDSLGITHVAGTADSNTTHNGYGLIYSGIGGPYERWRPQYGHWRLDQLLGYGVYAVQEAENESANQFAGYEFSHGTGSAVADTTASSGVYWRCRPPQSGGIAAELSTSVYPRTFYRYEYRTLASTVRLRVTDNSSNEIACIVHIWINSRTVARDTIRCNRFGTSNGWQDFTYAYSYYPKWAMVIPQIEWPGVVELGIDRVTLTSPPGAWAVDTLSVDSAVTRFEDYFARINPENHSHFMLHEFYPTENRIGKWWNDRSVEALPGHPGIGVLNWRSDIFQHDVPSPHAEPFSYVFTRHTDSATTNAWNSVQEAYNVFTHDQATQAAYLEPFETDRWFYVQVYSDWDCAADTLRMRDPQPNEIRTQALIALAYGCRGIGYFCYPSLACDPNAYFDEPVGLSKPTNMMSSSKSSPEITFRGLVDWDWEKKRYVPNYKYYAVQGLNVELDSLWTVIEGVGWISAGGGDTVGGIAGSTLDSIQSITYLGNPWIEVGFFQDSAQQGYCMLVNRRSLAAETQTLRVWLRGNPGTVYQITDMMTRDVMLTANRTGGSTKFLTTISPGDAKVFKIEALPTTVVGDELRTDINLGPGMYRVLQYSDSGSFTDSTLTGAMLDSTIPFTATFSPGQSKFFKIVAGPTSVSGASFPRTWQGGIAVGGSVTVDTNRLLTILAPADIRVTSGGGYAFNVYGTLVTEGIEADTSVMFHSAIGSTSGRSDWYGIKQLGPGNVTLKNTQIRDAYSGLRITSISTVDTVTVDHCDIRHGQMVGIYSEANSASKVSVVNSHISDIVSYGVEIYKGQATLQGNRFTDSMLYGVFVYGSPSWTSGAKILANSFDSLRTNNARGIYLQTLYNDGYAAGEVTIQDNEFGRTWLGTGQSAMQISNCSDSIAAYRNRIYGSVSGYSNDFRPEYGVFAYSTRLRLTGDLNSAESLSTFRHVKHGLYCASTMQSDPDFAIVRDMSFKRCHKAVYVYSNSRVNLGMDSTADKGNTAIHGYLPCGNYCWFDLGDSYTVHNANASRVLPALGNYWSNVYCVDDEPPKTGEEWDPCWPFIFVDDSVDHTGKLSSNPFTVAPLGKSAPVPVVGDEETGAEQVTDAPPPMNYPNPFNSGTVIEFSLADAAVVDVAVFNILGQLVRKLWDGEMAAGHHSIPWDGRDARGNGVASGMYFYRIASPQSQITKKMVVVK